MTANCAPAAGPCSVKGVPGVSLDDLVYVGTKIAKQIDMEGFDRMLDTADVAQQAIRDAEPLLKVSF